MNFDEHVKEWRREKNRAQNRQRRASNPEKSRARQRKWRAANPEKARARSRQWKAANPEKSRASSRRWEAANPEKSRASSRHWYAANPEKAHARSRRWAAANPEKVRAISARRSKEITDSYVKNIIQRRTGVPSAEIPELIIRVVRTRIKALRAIAQCEKILAASVPINEQNKTEQLYE